VEGEHDTVEVASFNRRYEAEMAQGYLNDVGIESMISADDAGGADLGLSMISSARVLVRIEDEERAVQVLGDAGVL
jgi:hypothetical protein